MNNIERDGANAVNTLDRQAAITGGSFSVKIGKTRFVVCVLTTENNGKTLETALREACAQDILNEARRSNLDHLEKMRKTSWQLASRGHRLPGKNKIQQVFQPAGADEPL